MPENSEWVKVVEIVNSLLSLITSGAGKVRFWIHSTAVA